MNKAQEMRHRETVAKMTLAEKARLCSGKDAWHTEQLEKYGIEGIFMSDGPHGLRIETDDTVVDQHSKPATCFPAASALACSFDRDLAREVGEALGAEAAAEGLDLVLGPGVNIKRSPLCGRNFEYFSEDPYLAGEMAAAQIVGIQSTGVGACIKHYAANSQENRRLVSDSTLDNRALHEIYLEAFRIAVQKARPYAVMSAYNQVNGEYAGESEYLIEEVLRGRFGFDGAVISDWSAVCDRVQGIRAGLDLEMPGKASGTTRLIIDAVKSGELDEKKLDDCVVRLLALEARCKDAHKLRRPVDFDLHHELVRRAAAESAVLLKNDNNLLPFADGKPFAVIGAFATAPRYQGAGSSRVNATRVSGVLDELDALGVEHLYAQGYNADGSTNPTLLAEAKEAAEKAGRAVIFVGLPEQYESEGYDREDMSMPDGMLRLIDAVLSVCPKTAVYLMLGAPVLLPFADRAPAILCGYLGGQAAGQAAADVVTGRICPGGRLAESWPQKQADVPCARYYGKNRKLAEYREGVYVGYRYYIPAGVRPLYAFGHGLSYTRIEIDGISCDRKTLGAGEKAVLTFRVRNAGKRDGYAVPQVYIARRDDPYRVLRCFEKVHLFAGESRILKVELDADSFAFHDGQRDRRFIEMGDHTVMVGYASDDIAGSVDITVWAAEGEEMPAYITPQQATDLPDEEFYALLGRVPQEPPRTPYTMNSTVGELRQRTAGKIFYSALSSYLIPKDADLESPVTKQLVQSLDNTPIRSVCAMSRGILSRSKAMAVVELANRKVLRGLYYVIKK